ncbi:ROK family protein [Sphingomonas sp. 1P06PA]|uniref:ROK family protein n=1 Tax=Sphingomonas sp. 1P06PA TaxID=554121 RepID=UPI0039A6CF33
MTRQLFAAVEAGGTKFVCGIGDAIGGSRETARIDTRDPHSTLADVIVFFRAASTRHGPLAALGIGSFGPLQLDPDAADHGALTTTPKPGWRGAPLLAPLAEALGLPAAIDTDVNAAALAEARIGAGRGARSLAYVTIGTGIGVGLYDDGRLIHGAGHPEAGHLLLRRHPALGDFAGVCPYHGDCLEGVASGPAIAARWGAALSAFPADHSAFAAQADHVAQLVAMLALVAAPEHVVLGGGVMAQEALFPMIRARTRQLLAGYIPRFDDPATLDARITPPGCIEPSGLVGAYLLAEDALTVRPPA